jgi:hypothetical protein
MAQHAHAAVALVRQAPRNDPLYVGDDGLYELAHPGKHVGREAACASERVSLLHEHAAQSRTQARHVLEKLRLVARCVRSENASVAHLAALKQRQQNRKAVELRGTRLLCIQELGEHIAAGGLAGRGGVREARDAAAANRIAVVLRRGRQRPMMMQFQGLLLRAL